MKRILFLLLVTNALMTSVECARQQSGLVSESSFTNAQLLRADSGSTTWVISAAGLQSVNTGQVGSARRLPTSDTVPSVAFADDVNGWLGALAAGSIRVYHTSDGGSVWASAGSTTILGNEPIADVRIAAIGERIVVIAIDQTSSNFSSAAALVSADGGKTWSTSRAPVAGRISALVSTFWLVGGVQGNQVYTSATGLVWTPVSLSVSGATWSAGTPVAISGSRILLPLTIRDANGVTRISMRVSGDNGGTWTEAATVSPPENTAVGIAVPVSISQDGTWETITTDGTKVYQGNVNQPSSAPSIVSPNGLTGNPIGLVFLTRSQGVALTTSSACPSGKPSCTTIEKVFGSDDGGQTWSEQTSQ